MGVVLVVAAGLLGLLGGFVLAKRASTWCPGCGERAVAAAGREPDDTRWRPGWRPGRRG